MIKLYYRLTKPGIIFGNGMTALAGFFLASRGHINLIQLLATFIGISLGIASACVFNNYVDRGIDSKMERTKNRALVTGAVSSPAAIIFASILGLIGVIILYIFTNITTLLVGAVGFLFYEIFYGISKRSSIWSTVIGSVSGAMPPVAGYTAVTGNIDLGAVILFFILVFWQIPHFYSIAIYRLKDYKKAGIPVLPVVKGIFVTKVQILFYTIGFAIVTTSLSFTGYTGKTYLIVMSIFCLVWVAYAAKGFSVKNTPHWARRMFVLSLIINVVVCIMITTNSLFV
ncbi:MAG TPA: heme o synthase [Candidatus Saccharimonadales bacterium]|nr:heme o synthase [Candidatus Saccharimonadales bacterium]